MGNIKIVGRMDLDNLTTKDDVSIERVGNNIHFSCPQWITKEYAVVLQKQLGYHPAGYSFCGYKADMNGTQWYCWNSCD